jgi:hypothetical protein
MDDGSLSYFENSEKSSTCRQYVSGPQLVIRIIEVCVSGLDCRQQGFISLEYPVALLC